DLLGVEDARDVIGDVRVARGREDRTVLVAPFDIRIEDILEELGASRCEAHRDFAHATTPVRPALDVRVDERERPVALASRKIGPGADADERAAAAHEALDGLPPGDPDRAPHDARAPTGDDDGIEAIEAAVADVPSADATERECMIVLEPPSDVLELVRIRAVVVEKRDARAARLLAHESRRRALGIEHA